jgi:hypothetical protein
MSFVTDLFAPPSMCIVIGSVGNFMLLYAHRMVWQAVC